jgi:hypothetical protein
LVLFAKNKLILFLRFFSEAYLIELKKGVIPEPPAINIASWETDSSKTRFFPNGLLFLDLCLFSGEQFCCEFSDFFYVNSRTRCLEATDCEWPLNICIGRKRTIGRAGWLVRISAVFCAEGFYI